MTNYDLLRLLDDPAVRRKILEIVAEPKKFSEPEKILVPEKISPPIPDESLSKLDTENSRLKETLRTKELEKNSAQRQLADLRGENLQLKNSLATSQQRVKDLEQQIKMAQYKNSRLESSLSQSEQSARSLQDKLKEWQGTFTREQQRAKNLQRELDDAQERISELEAQLQQRFARGWELFQKYRRVGSHARQLLQGVFPRDDFTSFICGGAQVNSLETLWDVLRECVMNNRPQDAEILSEVFEYCLELVNAAKAQAGYSILPVNVGDRFDSDLHSEGPNSRAQGKISNVYLPGYKNDYNGRVIKKSIVQVS